ncbi:heat-inducible transcriptional repressor HrcA [Sporolactobacillus terrae]|uniref:Heat-inducible transcription repressor HrcA n=1 Tax=Sporolactobacillus terrae TaxID=269673 RepID=A0A410D9U1_9BACL|nr:heat-inducible transcriptional repressor HrcA [Sporolactobacillus terrae]QAA22845.1 heat-inducible transcriptional repressor HrcA [Sporolactobacillus terrae]QAA25819.1 heat-inducible transcriptional repressor HrcA [Sporolactobacillus terrae]UAK17695.1 heat-inducible transcriptional repressor HrcA [Sporolactobacillus terrae]BBN99243.1 heat-inducible transcription repressor HrcA [Sporolactobacillus terrae]
MLTDRQLFLLQLLVNDYVVSAEPVGSRSIAKRDDVHFSPATIRNELADLEEMGFLEKTHLSSGRVPSEKGYRFYVDHLLSPVLLSEDEVGNIRHAYRKKFSEKEELIRVTAQVLSEFTNYTAIMLGPELMDMRLKHIQMVKLNQTQGVLIIVTDTGHVENKMVTFPKSIRAEDIEKIINILNDKLENVPLYQLQARLNKEISNVMRLHIRDYNRVMNMLQESLTMDDPEQIFCSGKNNILAQPEFQDVKKIISLLNVLEGKEIVHEIMSMPATGLHIRIGRENKLNGIEDCSLITTTYSMGGEHLGTVAVIGPKRMAYPRVVTLIDTVSKILTENLTK